MKKYFLHLLAVAAVLSAVLSCGHHQQQVAQKQTEADSLINAAVDAEDYERVITLCDSLQQTGDISDIRAAYERAFANEKLDKSKLAVDEYKKALAETPKNEADSLWIYLCVCNLTGIYSLTRNDEGVLQLALPKIEEMKVWAEKKSSDKIFECLQALTCCVGQTQLRLGMKKEAEKMFELSVSYVDMRKSTSHTLYGICNNAILINNIITFFNAKDYTTAEKFLPRLDSLASEITAIQDSTAAPDVDLILSVDYLNHAAINHSLNRPKEAARYLALYHNTQNAKTLTGRINPPLLTSPSPSEGGECLRAEESDRSSSPSGRSGEVSFLKMQYDNQPLGLWEDDPFYGESIDDIRGKQLLIYTDGLNEAENPQKELFGNKRLLELMSDSTSLESHQVIDMLKSAVEEHRNGAEPNDDLTLMCIRLNI